ncbi:hypothetical protein [Mesorhizobium sp.]|uniref:hypothetical protein n=1 Tax=Mesorhizobium sp. TaxID=1871066 RepID=UPI0025BD928D|nr:hypothetical protein [Mesorhizobium sp.]
MVAFRKKVARAAYDKALERALASIMAEFKRRANAATTASEMWEVEGYLKEQRRDLDRTFDYRYSQLTMVSQFSSGKDIWTRICYRVCPKKNAMRSAEC